MKNRKLIVKVITFATMANPGFALLASAAPKPSCSYKGMEKPFFAAVQNQLRAEIIALKEKGIPVVDSSINAKMKIYDSGPKKNDPVTFVIEGGFRSESGTSFSLELYDKDINHNQDGFIPIGPLQNYVKFYPEIESESFDPEGNPVNGRCFLNSHGVFTVKNKQTGVAVAQFPSLTKFLVR